MLYVMFAAIGFAQAAVTVNTFPMVWEISRFGNVGKYTGFYYTCSMAAQVVTPILSGYLLQYVGYNTLFPYAAAFIALAIIPISLTKYGDSKPGKPQSKLRSHAGRGRLIKSEKSRFFLRNLGVYRMILLDMTHPTPYNSSCSSRSARFSPADDCQAW